MPLRLRTVFLLIFSLRVTALVAHTAPPDSVRQPPRWRVGVVAGSLLQRIAAKDLPLSPTAEQRGSPGVQAGLVGRWGAKNGVWSLRLETTYTAVSHRWLDPENSTDLRYRSSVIGVAPLLDIALLRSRRLHLLAGVQINTYLSGSREVGKELSGVRYIFFIDNQWMTIDYTHTDSKFRPSGIPIPLRSLLGVAWEVHPRLEIGLRAERGETVRMPILRFPIPALANPIYNRPVQSGRLVAARLAVTWWLR